MVGLVIGIARFAWESAYPPVLCGEEEHDRRPAVIKDVHYLHFGMLLFAVVVVTTVVVSLLTPPIDDKHVSFLVAAILSNKTFFCFDHFTVIYKCMLWICDRPEKLSSL